MRVFARAAVAAALLSGCDAAGGGGGPAFVPNGAVGPDGYTHYSQNSGTIQCPPGPVSLDANRSRVQLVGNCTTVVIAGSHSDITVEIAPRGSITITGNHNDINWRQSRPGPPPSLAITQPNNSFHKIRGSSY